MLQLGYNRLLRHVARDLAEYDRYRDKDNNHEHDGTKTQTTRLAGNPDAANQRRIKSSLRYRFQPAKRPSMAVSGMNPMCVASSRRVRLDLFP